ncbi:FliM/FliN family flagellar motor C-terminal domain-containing protein [Primorskyibacter sp. 2E107]|uniref:FliM/FliN family flagellar motor switch protein n=1 Tax=Primorskyibacter sp. 2E107 TaxID=3403458 RepID=UPI003AF780CC
MSDSAHKDVLGQKAQAAQRAFEARGMSPAKALRRALSRTADINWDLALVTQSVNIENLDQDGVVEGLNPADLLVLIDGPDGALGLVAFDREVVTALVEVQTIQQVTQMPVDTERHYSPTDAAMMAPMIDGTLERFAQNLGDHPLVRQISGYEFGAMLEDARSAGLLLDASGYRAFRAEVDLALGRRRGFMSIILPERPKPRASDPDSDANRGPGPHEEVFSRVPARLNAVLAQLRMPLNKAQALKPGDLVPLPPDALDRVQLTAGQGRLVASGRLGQLNGMRAVRLCMPVQAGAGARPGNSGASDDGLDDFGPSGGGKAAVADDLPALAPMGDFGDEPAFDPGQPEALPDLPAMDFAAEAGDFDMDFGSGDGGEFDFNPASADGELPDLGEGFASAPVEFDFEE